MPQMRSPFDEYELGDRLNDKLQELARIRHRSPRAQTLALVCWALERACAGVDVELTQDQLEALRDERLQVA